MEAYRTEGQKGYGAFLSENEFVICTGPAGSGKTHIALTYSCSKLKLAKEKPSGKLVIIRPVVESTKTLGYLPGDIASKLNPYIQPCYDILRKHLGHDKLTRYLRDQTIEGVAINYCRGRTFEDSIIVVDEAQNATFPELQLILTRLGEGSRMIMTGDLAQSDLPVGVSGLGRLLEIFPEFQYRLKECDIQRHWIVKLMLERLK